MKKVFTVHGFQSNSSAMNNFVEVLINALPHDQAVRDIEVYPFNWESGVPTRKIERFFSFLSSPRNYGEKTIIAWDEAQNQISNAAKKLAYNVNLRSTPSETILIIAHSMGTQVVLESLDIIDKKNKVFLLLMGGISSELEYAMLDSYENVLGAFNLYSANDFILERLLSEISCYSTSAIGTTPISSNKVINIKTNFGHSEYMESDYVLRYLYLRKCLGIKPSPLESFVEEVSEAWNTLKNSLSNL
ncbi:MULTISPECIES: alpha/beta hydrolase [Pantoea]|uniref:alpha/beta hydrolase n=1 Tax=Pantoea TaxID=53335 RepID=UPI001B312BB0|nr:MULTISPECIES: alpha/beta hydrolase [Pantoea]MDI3365985.1 alpha/beta hydrolase [Pantoea sp. V108_6]